MSVLVVNENNFEEEVLKENKKVLIDFYANWCGPCKMMSPIIDEVAKELGEEVRVGKVNIDENMELADKYEIMSIPTIVIFKDGKIETKFVGVTEKSVIIEALKA